MSEMRIRAAKALEAAAKAEHATVGGYRYYLPDADAALLAALDPEDEALVELAAKTDFEFTSDAAIEPSLWKDADEDERYVARLHARAVIRALRDSILSPQEHGGADNV